MRHGIKYYLPILQETMHHWKTFLQKFTFQRIRISNPLRINLPILSFWRSCASVVKCKQFIIKFKFLWCTNSIYILSNSVFYKTLIWWWGLLNLLSLIRMLLSALRQMTCIYITHVTLSWVTPFDNTSQISDLLNLSKCSQSLKFHCI